MKAIEILAVVVTLLAIAASTVLPFSKKDSPDGVRVVRLTGVAATGTWTEGEVTGSNYWGRAFAPARPILRAGEPVVIRLTSPDVNHTFFAPALGVGPVEVHPGHVEEVRVVPDKDGVYEYFCTTVCGNAHFGMRGEFVVVRDGQARLPPPRPRDAYWEEPPPPVGASRVEQGRSLFRRMGCFNCHGIEGKGGVANWNYIKDFIPVLKTTATTIALEEKEDAQKLIALLERGVSLESMAHKPPVGRFNLVLAKYKLVKDVIREGREAGKKDPKGPTPPLQMPSWGQRLSETDIESIVAYLLTLQPWDQVKKKEEETKEEESKEEERE